MNQRGGLQGLAWGFLGHPGAGQFSQLLIDQRQQFLGRFSVALLDSFEDPGHIAHRGLEQDSAAQTPTQALYGFHVSALVATTRVPSLCPQRQRTPRGKMAV